MHVHASKTIRPLVIAAGLAVLASGCTDDQSPTGIPPARASIALLAMPEGYVVEYAPDAGEPSAEALAAAGATVTARLPHLNAIVVDAAADPAALEQLPGVTSVVEDARVGFGPAPELAGVAGSVEGDAFPAGTDQSSALRFASGQQWNMRLIRVHEVWGPSKGGLGAKVCVIDTGIDETHQELTGKVAASRSFVPNPGGAPQLAAIDSNFHGTHVASTITSNGIEVASVAPDAMLLIAKVFAASGSTPSSRVWEAIRWCTDEGADVINLSLGSFFAQPESFIAMYQAGVDYAISRGVVVVAAAGNENRVLPHPTNISLPAQLTGVLNVGAVGPVTSNPAGWPNVIDDTYDRRGFYSNYGTDVDVFAPGGRGSIPLSFLPRRQGSSNDNIVAACASAAIASCASGRSYVFSAGTSMAAPHVAGLAALLRAEIGGERSVAVAERVKACIVGSTVDIGPTTTFGGGRIDAVRAFAMLQEGGC